MRVVIVTGTEPHHKSLCTEISKAFNVVGIMHPASTPRPVVRGRRFVRQAKTDGWPLAIMHVLGKLASRSRTCVDGLTGASLRAAFSGGTAGYQDIPRSLIHSSCDVHDPRSWDLLRSLRPNVTLCLGGPLYPKQFIDASPLMLNYHSGVSPIYNGSDTIRFAFANGHPHLCGGTLMIMSPDVDGGALLGHYLPAIDPGDSPESLFAKTVRGAAMMYRRLLQSVERGQPALHPIDQPKALFVTRGFQFGWYQSAMIERNLRADIAARFQRRETLLEYWREPDAEAAKAALHSTLHSLLWDRGRA